MGLEPVVEPVLQVRPVKGAAIDLAGADALAFTSQAAVVAFAALSPERGLRVFAVGAATAAAARDFGFSQIEPLPDRGDVQGLAALIAETGAKPRLVVNPTARQPAANLAALLAARRIATRSVAVYETVRTGLAAAPADIAGVVIHSARAGEAVAKLVPPGEAPGLVAYAISEVAAAALRQRGFGRILIAETPDEASLLQRIAIDQNRPRTHEGP